MVREQQQRLHDLHPDDDPRHPHRQPVVLAEPAEHDERDRQHEDRDRVVGRVPLEQGRTAEDAQPGQEQLQGHVSDQNIDPDLEHAPNGHGAAIRRYWRRTCPHSCCRRAS